MIFPNLANHRCFSRSQLVVTMRLIALFVASLHLMLVLGLAYSPFSKSDRYKTMAIVILASIMVHWVLNDGTCLLTLIESKVTGKPVGDGFISSIVHPVYSIKVVEIWVLTLGLLGYLLWTTKLTLK